MNGKQVRMAKLFRENSRMVMIPMDHGLTLGPIKGLEDIGKTVAAVSAAGADAVALHKGMMNFVGQMERSTSLIVHVSASSVIGPDSSRKVIVCSVEEALALGATAISTHINIGSAHEAEQLIDNAAIAADCQRYGLPLVVMSYPRGPGIDEHDPQAVAHAVRIAVEIGADVVKTNYTGSVESFREVVESSPVPLLIAGGGMMDDELGLFKTVADAMEAGAAGVSIGRNVFSHEFPGEMARQVVRIVHEGISAEEAYAALPSALNFQK